MPLHASPLRAEQAEVQKRHVTVQSLHPKVPITLLYEGLGRVFEHRQIQPRIVTSANLQSPTTRYVISCARILTFDHQSVYRRPSMLGSANE